MAAMTLSEFLMPRSGRHATIARALGVSESLVTQWSRGAKPIPHERCPQIEAATDGILTCEQLRPDLVWIRLTDATWPHHACGRPLYDSVSTARVEPDKVA